jgi:hypothetical protein
MPDDRGEELKGCNGFEDGEVGIDGKGDELDEDAKGDELLGRNGEKPRPGRYGAQDRRQAR